ncbi:MAG: ASCH domain-containing protein [bacterium]|nr:ASCH domain-containing protein [bacterium]MDY4108644.1 ASCH domain-containing protein [Bacilli bacterium]MDY4184089.1 ASCH domain-containing protein [Candidatus Onthovivens sp.]
MKVLTLKQPWATLVAEGIKKYEFRSWKINYRGKVLIHAGVGIDKEEMKKFKNLNLEFPSRRILAEVEIEDCLELDDNLNKKIISENNIAYGSKYRTGYAWKLKNVKKINVDKEINGKLGLWNIDLKDLD